MRTTACVRTFAVEAIGMLTYARYRANGICRETGSIDLTCADILN